MKLPGGVSWRRRLPEWSEIVRPRAKLQRHRYRQYLDYGGRQGHICVKAEHLLYSKAVRVVGQDVRDL